MHISNEVQTFSILDRLPSVSLFNSTIIGMRPQMSMRIACQAELESGHLIHINIHILDVPILVPSGWIGSTDLKNAVQWIASPLSVEI